MRSFSSATSLRRDSASSFLPSFISAPISRLDALRRAFSASDSAMARRRSASSAAKSSSAAAGKPRASSAARTRSRLPRT
jgi:hypothetical protein